ncbi:MAG: DNA/RNA non-specific endonuclease [Chitinophagaceae bacterium]|nr:DNA/RNA non-specific endonuclease [Chitinophagaceae bacterium]
MIIFDKNLRLYEIISYSAIINNNTFLCFSQNPDEQIKKLELELVLLHKKEDSLLSKIEGFKFQKIRNDLNEIGLPKLLPGEAVIHHAAYSLVYAEPYEQAKWVAHIILPDVVRGNEGRTNDFRPDSSIKTGSAVESDYFLRIPLTDSTFKYDGFGYDRGHLAPSADFRYSKKALSESYLYSNMSPQKAAFNRGRWSELEDAVRQYVVRNKTQLYVVTGGVLKEGLQKIERGINKVAIPEQYFKVVLDHVNKRAIGFLMPNKDCEYPVMNYACTIDSIEALTGIDFFANLPDAEENKLESAVDINKWIGERELGDVLPLRADSLPRNTFNTVQAQYYIGKNENIKVCGTVVSTKLSSKGNIFLNLDKKFPKQIFSVSIFKDKVSNFSYKPDVFLFGKTVCITGKVTNFNGTPTMNIESEKFIEILEE